MTRSHVRLTTATIVYALLCIKEPYAGGALSLLAAEHANVDGSISFYGTPDAKLTHVSAYAPFEQLLNLQL